MIKDGFLERHRDVEGVARIPRVLALVSAAAALVLLASAPPGLAAPAATHGVVVGDVSARSAIVWARADRAATLNVRLSGPKSDPIAPVAVAAEDDYTGQVHLRGLSPGTRYRYRAWFSLGGPRTAPGPVIEGSFRTAPREHVPRPVRLAFGGDISGQNVCRDASEGLPIMDTIRAARPDIFVGLGDMIYADNACGPTGLYGNAQVPGDFGPAGDIESFWAHWRYNRADAGLQRLLASADYVGVWDDHEVVNDFGPTAPLMPVGLRAFSDYTPLATEPTRLYRSLRWGRNLELFVLDTRQYRDPNSAEDSAENPKTMLGAEQLAWLKDGLAASEATWNVIVSSVPLSIPTGFPPTNGRDGWANFDQSTGFEHELIGLLRFMQQHGIRNTVWITTDVHFAEAFRYTPFPEDPRFVVHELATGPLNAGIFPNQNFDETLNPERLAFFGPAAAGDVTSWAQAKHWFNFGTLTINSRRLRMRIIDAGGVTRFELGVRSTARARALRGDDQ